MIPVSLQSEIEQQLTDSIGKSVRIAQSTHVGGGCIHQAQRLQTNVGDFFLKFNHPREAANFRAEAAGLDLLRSAGALRVPEVIRTGQTGEHAFLLMEYIASGPRKRGFWTEFGKAMAAMHGVTQPKYGWGQDNFIGRLPQANEERENWIDFFVEMRLEPQLVMAEAGGLADANLRRAFEKLYVRLPDLIPEEPASLLHGDLWSGNFMVGPEGEPVIIDPAVYYGHREMEIAFTRLFGGFDREFYVAYDLARPLQKGWESRVDLMNLYPLAVHLNLFGRSYLPEIQSVLRKFT